MITLLVIQAPWGASSRLSGGEGEEEGHARSKEVGLPARPSACPIGARPRPALGLPPNAASTYDLGTFGVLFNDPAPPHGPSCQDQATSPHCQNEPPVPSEGLIPRSCPTELPADHAGTAGGLGGVVRGGPCYSSPRRRKLQH